MSRPHRAHTDPCRQIQEHLAIQYSKQLEKMTLNNVSEKGIARRSQKLHQRKDSFYHLQNTMVKRSEEKKALVQQLRSEKMVESQRLQREAEMQGLTEVERWQQQLKLAPNDFSRAFASNNWDQ